jgi:hypothetical protein
MPDNADKLMTEHDTKAASIAIVLVIVVPVALTLLGLL